MFFTKAKNARMYATMEIIRTHKNHKVKKCKKYLCPPKTNLGLDYILGFTVVLDISTD